MTPLEKFLAEGDELAAKATREGDWYAQIHTRNANAAGDKIWRAEGPPGFEAQAKCDAEFLFDARTRVVKQAAIIRVMREALEGLAEPLTRHDYSVGALDEVVCKHARDALAESERIAEGK